MEKERKEGLIIKLFINRMTQLRYDWLDWLLY